MTVGKRFKRLVRAHARQSGQPYTAALEYFRRLAEVTNIMSQHTDDHAPKGLPWNHKLVDCEREATATGLPEREARIVVSRGYGFATWRQLEVHLTHPAGLADFLQLACLQYFPTDSPALRERARAMLSADPSLAERDIWTAACVGDVATVRRALDSRPELVNLRGGYHDWEPLLYACYSRLDLPERSTLAVARLLLERGADPNAHYMWGGQYRFTALTGAFGGGEMGIVNQPEHQGGETLARLLLDAGADPNDGQALYNRMFDDGHATLALLLDYGLNAEHRLNWLTHQDGRLVATPVQTLGYQLQWAVRKHHVERARLLIDHGADLSMDAGDGRTLYEAAAVSGRPDLAHYLAEHGADVVSLDATRRLAAACNAGDADAARALLDRDPDLLTRLPKSGGDLLTDAAGYNRLEAARVMLEIGCPVNPSGTTPLHQAALKGHVEMAELLIANGADVSARDDRHATTPLQWAQVGGHPAIQEFLASCSLGIFDAVLLDDAERVTQLLAATPDLVNATVGAERRADTPHASDWQTPLAVAVLRNRPQAAKVLIDQGASIDVADSDGRSLADIARAQASPQLIELIEARADTP